ncbi:gamma-glutamyl-gamma-aminobutyrate hydrolase family protein [Sphingomonas sp.]|uniref:gamma-glutamyl-gamma-aminobutyrate hydrolase family protein n=1 Tax=Sphingomonas sp. TaxID=28214 RepID=UPI002DD6502E|nr:gamma-glutamyl-gamma-aminobutyrate hydrolase family protein [Sphingomonas sp.]
MIGACKPVLGIMCVNEVAGRPIQAVATRFVEPVARLCNATVLLVPAVPGASDAVAIAGILDGLLLTGARSHVAPAQYGAAEGDGDAIVDPGRDTVALALADRMIGAGKPVYGICRGLQEINVLFGGTLSGVIDPARHHRGSWEGDYAALFAHRHAVQLAPGGVLARSTGQRRLEVNSVHQQGIDRLGGGLMVEATACDDGLVEAIRAPGCGADVLAVQWHPEWDVAHCAGSRSFFTLLGGSMRRGAEMLQ